MGIIFMHKLLINNIKYSDLIIIYLTKFIKKNGMKTNDQKQIIKTNNNFQISTLLLKFKFHLHKLKVYFSLNTASKIKFLLLWRISIETITIAILIV